MSRPMCLLCRNSASRLQEMGGLCARCFRERAEMRERAARAPLNEGGAK